MSKSGFFYGAGRNAEINMERWVRRGYEPYCFVDTDINKQNMQFMGYEILSLCKAIKTYGEQKIFITLTEKYHSGAVDYLLQNGITKNDIILLDENKLNPQKRADDHIATANDYLEFGRHSKHILDIGCGDGRICRTIAEYYNCSVKGIDVVCSNQNGEGWSTEMMDARDLKFEDNSFDAIISIATLEHLPDLKRVFSEMHRVLRPAGKVYITGGPIWSCAWGNHYNHHITYDPVFSILPKYCHLYMSKDEMAGFLLDKGFSEDIASYVIKAIYDSEYLNRISSTQIVEEILKTDFRVNTINQTYTAAYHSISPDIKKILEADFSAADLAVSDMAVKLIK